MALPVEPRHTESLFSEILRFLWTKQVDGNTKQKRRLVAKRRISAGIEMGGLGIQHPDEIVQGGAVNRGLKRFFPLFRPLHLIEAYVWPEKY
jgi:hypothetical protein